MPKLLVKIVDSRLAKFITGAVVVLLGIYGTFFYERKPDLTIEIVSSYGVLDIRESLTKLAIIYDGTNLQATNQNLHLLVIRIANYGAADILKSHFDEAAPLGFEVTIGKILETPTIAADEYLKTNLKASVRNENAVVFVPRTGSDQRNALIGRDNVGKLTRSEGLEASF